MKRMLKDFDNNESLVQSIMLTIKVLSYERYIKTGRPLNKKEIHNLLRHYYKRKVIRNITKERFEFMKIDVDYVFREYVKYREAFLINLENNLIH